MQNIRTKRKYNRLLAPRGRYYNIGGVIGGALKNPFSGANGTQMAQAGIGAGIGAIGQLGGGLIGGGLQSGAGNAISNIGGTIGGALSAVNPVLGGVVSAASGLIGGLTNKMFGSKMNKENIAKVEGQIGALNAFQSDVADFDSLTANWNSAPTMAGFSNSYIGKDGWFSKKAKKKANALREEMNNALAFRDATLVNNAENIVDEQADNLLANYAAFGGELGTNGADFTNGMIQINSGGTHEQNPNEGVLFGMDSEGIPNLVEEGEVIFNDYVFSNRIKVPKTIRKKHRLTDNITFADAAKELAKESEERPNDPISQNGLEYLMDDLMTEQEMIKAKREKNKFSKGGRVNKYPDGTPLLDRPVDMTDFSWMQELEEKTNPTPKKNTKASNSILDIANLRYIPALGAAIGVTTDLLGLTNKPDYEPANMVLEASKGMSTAPSVRFNPIGNYLTYNPFDRDYYINKMNSEAGASRRAIGNSGGSAGARMAAVLAGDNNYLNSLGTLARQAEEYNLAQRQQVENFNRATNQYNSEGSLKADIANAENRLKTANLRMESTIAGAKLRQAAKDASDMARSTNLTNLFDSLGNIGWEEYQRNAIESNPALGGYYQSRTGNVGYRRKNGGYLTIKKRRK